MLTIVNNKNGADLTLGPIWPASENNDQGQKSMKNNEIQFIYTLCGQHNVVYMEEGVP